MIHGFYIFVFILISGFNSCLSIEDENGLALEPEAVDRLEDLCAKYGSKHTMCLPKVGPDCGDGSMNGKGLSEQEKKLIVDLHNEQRRKIATGGESGQPKAGNMRQLTWDDDLAVVAQRWADQCKFEHDTGEARIIPTYESVGQNLYSAMATKKAEDTPVEKAVMAWYNEVLKFQSTSVDPFKFSEETGHYTQLAWGDTFKVGCGVSGYQSGKWWKRLVACNYGTAGNWVGKPMYIQGEPCSKCQSGTTCSNSLCA